MRSWEKTAPENQLLMKILYGMIPADSGEILYRGKPIRFANPGEAIRSKIGMVLRKFC
jgi:simple sugar transport system ATP-binding protein